MVTSILDSEVTYASLIDLAASSLYNVLSNESVNGGIYRKNSSTFTIANGMYREYGKPITKESLAKNVTIEVAENIDENYITPTKNRIADDIKNFMDGIGVPTSETNPTPDGIISFFFALNFFVEKAVMKRAITSPNNAESSYHLHYKAPTSSYSKIPYNYKELNSVTKNKIENIYSQLETTSLLSDNVRPIKIATGSYKSSCSSSSCSSSSSSSCSSSSSSSSCSSSSIFIAYFNIG
jgi:hypothetical protein